MLQNYVLLLIIIMTIFAKASADAYNYLFNKEEPNSKERKRYGIIYHLYGVFAIGVPISAMILNKFKGFDIVFIILGFALIYFGIFDLIYNKIAGRNIQYIGKTDIVDIWLGKIFDRTPFLKTVLLIIRWTIFIIGCIFILDLI